MSQHQDIFTIHRRLIGPNNHDKIEHARIAVVGVGGLGCTVAQSLVQLGIRHLRLIDGDQVELSNISRQTLFNTSDIGRLKVQVAYERLNQYPSHPEIKPISNPIGSDNAAKLLKDIEIIVDCTDNYLARYVISRQSEKMKVPMVYGGVNQFEGQVGVFNYLGSLAFHRLFPKIEDLMPHENCAASGVLPFVVQVIGNLQVTEVFKIITSHPDVLNNRLLCLNLLSGKQRILKLGKGW